MIIPELSQRLERIFDRIHQERMQGIPILNPAVGVAAIGFQPWEEGAVGVLVTPWMMNLLLIPADAATLQSYRLGDRVSRAFPSQEYPFNVNEIEGLGRCLMHGLYSPMTRFADHRSAVETAEAFLAKLMDESVEQAGSVDQERMARYLNGEDMAQIRLDEEQREAEREAARRLQQERAAKQISRRDLIRGAFLGS